MSLCRYYLFWPHIPPPPQFSAHFLDLRFFLSPSLHMCLFHSSPPYIASSLLLSRSLILSVSVSSMLILSRSAPSGVPEQVEDKLISLSLTLSHQQPSLAPWSCVSWNTPLLLSVCIYVDHTISMYIYGWITARRDISTAFELFTQRQLCLSCHTKGAIPVDFIQSCLGNLHPFSQLLSFFPSFSPSWLSVVHLKALLIIPTHTQNSCRRDTHKRTHHALISLIAWAG